MTFKQKISAYALGVFTESDLPGIAMTGLEENYVSESLRILAGFNSSENSFVLADYFKKAQNELHLETKESKDALKDIIIFYTQNIVNKIIDPYSGIERLHKIIGKTEFHFDDYGLMPCYTDYISIWEEKKDGLDFHTTEGLTKEQYIEKTEESIRIFLREWLIENAGS